MYAGSYQRIVADDFDAPDPSDRILARMGALHPSEIELSLARIERLLADLGRPQDHLPPVVHVAGTNGKGSTIAFMKAIMEARGGRVHAYTSPHLLKFNERITLATGAGTSAPISDEYLVHCLSKVEEANAGRPITFFEITTAAALLACAETPADALLLETGMGGRLDATNVVAAPQACVITTVSLDHTQYLGATIGAIAHEKAGIIKSRVPCVVGRQTEGAMRTIAARARDLDARLFRYGMEFDVRVRGDRLTYISNALEVDLPLPGLRGAHQIENAGLAIAVAECTWAEDVCLQDLQQGLANARWPGRMETLGKGSLAACVRPGTEIVIDGAHNPGGAAVVAQELRSIAGEREVHIICGMMAGKDAPGVLGHFRQLAHRVYTVPVASRCDAIDPDELAFLARSAGLKAQAARGVLHALLMSRAAMRRPGLVVICGSLYLIGHALALHN